ncbi:inorganic pyrophosphatase [Vagococcus sp.]|uniref:inorganic pyrophosphatase n=1 Tax=Vagococcus sp. TaxID=1933889 RepID=UPI002FC60E09
MIKKFNVTVTIDRPIGYIDSHKNYYPINYGYAKGILAKDGEWQDAYILSDSPITTHTINGEVIAIIVRKNDVEDKWVVRSNDKEYTEKEIVDSTNFIEQYFDSTVYLLD